MGLLAVTCVLLLLAAGTVTPIRLGRGPEASEARAGETVELRCDVNSRDGEPILWHHSPSDTFLTYNRQLAPDLDPDRRQRYSLRGSEYWHVFNLRIENLKPIDNGFFYCGYLKGASEYIVLGSAPLTVIYPPDDTSPVCSFSLSDQPADATAAVIGSTANLTCTWAGGNPSPTAKWYRQAVTMDTHEEDGRVWTVRALTAEDNGAEFTCEMASPALEEKRSCRAMPLRIPPRATITPSTAHARVGDAVELVCEGAGEPRIASYSWEGPRGLSRRRERYELRAGNRVFRLLAAEATDDGWEFTCRVRTSRGLEGTATASLRIVPPTTPSPTTAAGATTKAVPSTTLKPPTAEVATGGIGAGAASPQLPETTPASPPPDSQPNAALPKTTVIGIGAAAGCTALLLVVVVLVICRRRSRKTSIRRDTSMHLVNSTYETVIEGGRVVDRALGPPAGFQSHDRPRPVAAVSPLPPDSPDGVPPRVRYAKVDKRKQGDSDPLYDRVPDGDEVDLGLKGTTTPRPREPTYLNHGGVEARQEPDPREFNAEGLTYADLELEREGRLHSKKTHTLYAKLK